MATVTISCRITPEQKFALVKRSEKLGMKLCSYIELLVLQNFDAKQTETMDKEAPEEAPSIESITIEEAIQAVSPTHAQTFEKYMLELQERYPDYTETELLNACLIHAFSNHKAWHQKSLKTYLKRLKKGQYDN